MKYCLDEAEISQHPVAGMANVVAFRGSSELSGGGSSTLISLLNLWNSNIQSTTDDVDRNVTGYDII